MTMREFEYQNHNHKQHLHRSRPCELCNNAAALYCSSDSAYLCFTCDAHVHRANFLVARHVRHTLCFYCFNSSGYQFSGQFQFQKRVFCPSCIPSPVTVQSFDSFISAATEASNTSTTTHGYHRHHLLPAVKLKELHAVGQSEMKDGIKKAGLTIGSGRGFSFPAEIGSSMEMELSPSLCKNKTKLDETAEAIFISWCRKLGRGLVLHIDYSYSSTFLFARTAIYIFRRMPPALPLRLSLAASFWLTTIRFSRFYSSCENKHGSVSSSSSSSNPSLTSNRTCQDLSKWVEEISGVPASSISAVGSRFAAAHHQVFKKMRTTTRRLGAGGFTVNNGSGGDPEEGWGETDH